MAISENNTITASDITTALNGKANSSHPHLKADITDFPTSMPASDVYSWAKASSKPSYSWDEINNKPGSFTPASHTQNINTISGIYYPTNFTRMYVGQISGLFESSYTLPSIEVGRCNSLVAWTATLGFMSSDTQWSVQLPSDGTYKIISFKIEAFATPSGSEPRLPDDFYIYSKISTSSGNTVVGTVTVSRNQCGTVHVTYWRVS